MVAGGTQVRSFDIVRQVTSTVMQFFGNPKRYFQDSPADGPILKLHYVYTFCLSMFGFATVWYTWFSKDVIICASLFNAEQQVRLDYLNICLTFPTVTAPNGETRHLLYYRWVHWVMFIVAFAFYIPRKLAKVKNNPELNKMIENLRLASTNYQGVDHRMVTEASKYMTVNVRTHDYLYWYYLSSHLVGLFINILCFVGIDAMLQNQYHDLGYKAFPFTMTRDGLYMTDHLNMVFPQFANCSIGINEMLTNQRTEKFGCHLTVQEFYEKIFVVMWMWQIGLMIVTTVYIIFLVGFNFPRFRQFFFKFPKPAMFKGRLTETTQQAGKNFKVGDWYLLYRLKSMFPNPAFCDLLQKLADRDFTQLVSESLRKELPVRTRANIGFGTPPHKGILIE